MEPGSQLLIPGMNQRWANAPHRLRLIAFYKTQARDYSVERSDQPLNLVGFLEQLSDSSQRPAEYESNAVVFEESYSIVFDIGKPLLEKRFIGTAA